MVEPTIPPEPSPGPAKAWMAAQEIPAGWMSHTAAGPQFIVQYGRDGEGYVGLKVRRWTGNGWGLEQIIDRWSGEKLEGLPKFATDRSGNFYIAWIHWNQADQVWFGAARTRRFDAATGEWGDVQQLISGSYDDRIDALSISDDGNAWIAWSSHNGLALNVAKWLPHENIYFHGRVQANPDRNVTEGSLMNLAFDRQGNALLLTGGVYSSEFSGYRKWAGYSPQAGWTPHSRFDESTEHASSYLVASPEGAGFWVFWHDWSRNDGLNPPVKLMLQRFEPGRGWTEAPTIFADAALGQIVTDVDVHPNGNMIVGWQRRSGAQTDLMTRVWSRAHGWGEPKKLTTLENFPRNYPMGAEGSMVQRSSVMPQVAIGEKGEAVAAWMRCDKAAGSSLAVEEPSECSIQTAHLGNAFSGSGWSVPTRITEPTGDDRLSRFRVTPLQFLANGEVMMAYHEPHGRFIRRFR